MLPVLNVGPFAIQTPLLILLLGLWFAMSIGARFAPRIGVEAKFLDDLILFSILFGLIGGRIFYVMRFPAAFLQNPTSILSLNPELFLLSGALLVGGITFMVILQRKNRPLWQTLDALTLPMAIFAIYLGISHLASGDVYGIPAELPWAIELWGAERHPTQIYEILAAGVIAGLSWQKFKTMINRPDGSEQIPGAFFLSFVVMTALAWMLIEPFRADSMYIVGNLRSIQVAAFLILLAAFYFHNKLRTFQEQEVREG